MSLSTAERNARADSTAGKISHYTLYQGDPFGAGSEVSGITRAAVSWTAAANGQASQVGDVTINVPAGSDFDHIVGMTAASGGTSICKEEIGQNTFGNQGTYKVTAGTVFG